LNICNIGVKNHISSHDCGSILACTYKKNRIFKRLQVIFNTIIKIEIAFLVQGDVMFKAQWIIGSLLLVAALNTHAAEGHSKRYAQCMNSAAGASKQLEQCTEKELKYHSKRLKKEYKTYLKHNDNQTNSIRMQQQQWENHLLQQCQNKAKIKGQYSDAQEAQCRLSMTIVQANRYEAKNFRLKK
jgi:uncharacterized protein YecT (DUF1311 family)